MIDGEPPALSGCAFRMCFPDVLSGCVIHPLDWIVFILTIILLIAVIIKIWLAYPDMATNLDLTHICIGGACP